MHHDSQSFPLHRTTASRTSVLQPDVPCQVRRGLLQGLGVLSLATAAKIPVGLAQAPSAPQAAPPFSANWLKAHARQLAADAYRPVPPIGDSLFRQLDWDGYRKIVFRPESEVWHGQDRLFRLRFFHLGHYYLQPVAVHEVVDGRAHRIAFSREMFDYGGEPGEGPLPENLGFAGFRIHFHTDFERDMAAFLGASYFRAVGREMQYGISARGLAIDTAIGAQEEFPFFKSFWIERPANDATALTVHALLDSPSMAGAYRFLIHPGAITMMDVEAFLYPRKTVQRLGLAPLTSMYHHGENDRREANDFRPEVHDSDGLAIWRGNGERLWRPLVNPATLRVNAFSDESPRGFGLLQRDRDFANYQDDGVYYDRRPSLWVEPQGDWGRGAIHLVEIPTHEEIFDNIVAFWTPERPPEPGQELSLSYRLHWGTERASQRPQVAHVIATRIGAGGIPGQRRTKNSHKFVVDFAGGDLGLLPRDAPVEPVITTSSGEIVKPAARPIGELGGWRANFDVQHNGRDTIDLRCYLKLRSSALSETWLYQWTPPA